MKEQIENLIQHQKTSIEEITEQLNNLTALQKTKLDLEDKVLISKAIVELEVELNMRGVFIHELETLL
jgi:hemerythrin-like domain-containing protein